MNRLLATLSTVVCALTWANAAVAQDAAAARAECERDFAPQSGQSGKDVVWVPTPDALVAAMLKAAKVTSNDLVYDLGAGDGKIAIAAARDYGARSVGVEYNPKMVTLAQCMAKASKVTDKTQIIQGDIFETDFSKATVVTLYLLPELNERLKPTLLKMKPGTRVVSNSFTMGDWNPDERIMLDDYERAYLWIIPAKVDGEWDLTAQGGEPVEVEFEQTYQHIEGTAEVGKKETKIRDAKLRGNEIQFTYDASNGPVTFKGTVDQGQIRGTATAGGKKMNVTGKKS